MKMPDPTQMTVETAGIRYVIRSPRAPNRRSQQGFDPVGNDPVGDIGIGFETDEEIEDPTDVGDVPIVEMDGELRLERSPVADVHLAPETATGAGEFIPTAR